MEKVLEVKNLKVSFKTSAGKVQAVRDISFDLLKGETLAIVGESGSGKSVTSKAIIGIQSSNAIVESGEILYDGQDLLKISEETYQKIRGNKIAMIFQDPMSSLNPIVKIGKQLTEAMIVKGRHEKFEAKREFDKHLKILEAYMLASIKGQEAIIKEECKKFKTFSYQYLKLQKAYNKAFNSASSVTKNIKDILFEIEKEAFSDDKRRLLEITKLAKESIHQYVVNGQQEELLELANKLHSLVFPIYKKEELEQIVEYLKEIKNIVEKQVNSVSPDFFAMAYFLCYSNQSLSEKTVDDLNIYLNDYLNKNFLNDFVLKIKTALEYCHNIYQEKEKVTVSKLKSVLEYYEQNEVLERKMTNLLTKEVIKTVDDAINHLSLNKNTQEYIFSGSLKTYLESYYASEKNNKKENKRFSKESKVIDNIVKRGKTPEWKPTPPSIIDEKQVRQNIILLIKNLLKHYENNSNQNIDYDKLASENVDRLKENASKVVFSITKKIAKEKAISILTEVGISEPHKRYNQYPFQFSGGMRQRIVIAIALVANPEILICDEPTTALDVTIQAGILELINKIKLERELSVIFITHDLGVVANMADKVAVMYAGKIVEIGGVEDIFYNPRHPYTWALLSSMPDLDTDEALETIPGTPPNMIYPPKGDAFAPRNKYALEIDFEEQPPMFEVSPGHYAATWLLQPGAPNVPIPKGIISRIERMKDRGVIDGK